MRDLLHAKFSQNEPLRKILLDTGKRELRHCGFRIDRFWGCGKAKGGGATGKQAEFWEGQNKMGELLMEVRRELAEEASF